MCIDLQLVFAGVTGPLDSVAVSDLLWLDITVKRGGVVYVPVSRESNAFVYMWAGSGTIGPPTSTGLKGDGEVRLECGQVAHVPGSQVRRWLGLPSESDDEPQRTPPQQEVVRVAASNASPDDVRFLLLAGTPLRRPFVYANGLFASSVEQLEAAIDAFGGATPALAATDSQLRQS